MEMAPRQPAATAIGCGKQHHKMTIAFLIGQAESDTRLGSSHCASTYTPVPIQETTSISQMVCHRFESTPIAMTRASSFFYDPSSSDHVESSSHSSRSGSPDSLMSSVSVDTSNSSACSNLSRATDTAFDLPSIDTFVSKRHDSTWTSESPTSMILAPRFCRFTTFGSISAPQADRHWQPVQDLVITKPLARVVRPPRPSYSEEQKFFIMYHRLIRGLSWPEIENRFASFFKLRTKDGLTSVYYRIRRSWGMEEVLKTDPDGSTSDRRKVESKAAHFPHDFLAELGYFV